MHSRHYNVRWWLHYFVNKEKTIVRESWIGHVTWMEPGARMNWSADVVFRVNGRTVLTLTYGKVLSIDEAAAVATTPSKLQFM